MADFGGIMHFKAFGKLIKLRGKVTIDPSNVKAEPGANHDGTTYRTFSVNGFGAEVMFQASTGEDISNATDVNWDALLKAPAGPIILSEDQVGVLHTWSGATFVGEPKVDRENGEVSGLRILSDFYTTSTTA